MLLVLGDVAGDRLVTQLGQLDPHFLGGDRVGSVADDRPVSTRRGELSRGIGDLTPTCEHLVHRRGQLAQRTEQRRAVGGGSGADDVGNGAREEDAGGNLRVERLRTRHAHLDVAAVGRVDDAVRFRREFAAAAIDDCEHRRTAGTGEVDRAVRVRRRSALADRDDEGVAHVEREAEPRQFGRGQRIDDECVTGERAQHVGQRASGDGGGSLPDDPHPHERSVGESTRDVVGQLRRVETRDEVTVAL